MIALAIGVAMCLGACLGLLVGALCHAAGEKDIKAENIRLKDALIRQHASMSERLAEQIENRWRALGEVGWLEEELEQARRWARAWKRSAKFWRGITGPDRVRRLLAAFGEGRITAEECLAEVERARDR